MTTITTRKYRTVSGLALRHLERTDPIAAQTAAQTTDPITDQTTDLIAAQTTDPTTTQTTVQTIDITGFNNCDTSVKFR